MTVYLPEEKDWDSYWIADSETNGLNPTKIWVVCLENLRTDERVTLHTEQDFRSWDSSHPDIVYCGHNFLSFDSPQIRRLWGIDIPLSRFVDTLVLDYLYCPKQKGGHSLESVGERFGQPKVKYCDWTQYSPDMLHRCQEDVSITKRLYKNLIKKMKEVGFSEQSIALEHNIREIIDDQQRNGFCFDRVKAEAFSSRLRRDQESLSKEIKSLSPPSYEAVRSYKIRLREDGQPFASYTRHLQSYSKVELNADKTEYTTYELREFDIASPQQRVKKLLSLGWVPETFTKKTKKGGGGNPQADEDSIIKYANKVGDPRIAAIAEWIVLQGRASMVEGWCKTAKQDCTLWDSESHSWIKQARPLCDTEGVTKPTSQRECTLEASQEAVQWPNSNPSVDTLGNLNPSVRPPEGQQWVIHGKVATCGAQSRRMTHWDPNTANIPSEANGAKYGKEVRELWTARPGRVLVGIDAKSLQMRLFLHYISAPEWLVRLYLEGDPHQYNADSLSKTLGFGVSRGGGGAKTIYYAFIFGGQDKKLGSILKRGPGVGKKVRATLYQITPGLEELVTRTKQSFRTNNGWLECLDGGWVRCPGEHAAINYLIQPAEAVVMKKASILLKKYLMESSITKTEVLLIGTIHDEMIFDCDPAVAEEVKQLGCKAIEDAGRFFNLHVPLEGEGKIGPDWHSVH